MRTATLMACGAGLLATLLVGRAEASYPAGVWAKIDRVTMFPNETSPTEVTIHGVFLVWSGKGPVGGVWGNQGYEAARAGYMHFACPRGQEATCLLAWKDLNNSIGDSCRGFGAQDEPPGTVRDDAICPAHPDKFPMGMGVVVGYTPCAELDKFVATDAGVAACDAGAIDGDAGVVTDGAAGASPDAAADTSKDALADTSIDPQPEPPGSGGAGGSPAAGSGGAGKPPGSGGSAGSPATGGASPLAASDSNDDGGCALATGDRHANASSWALALAVFAFARRQRGGERGRS